MNADTFKDFMKALELYHDRKFSKAARDAYWADLMDYGDVRITLALQASYGKFPPGRVPSINDIKALLGEIRETAQAKEKGSELVNGYPISRPRVTTQMGRDGFAIMKRAFLAIDHPDYLTGQQVAVVMMTEMEEKYPGMDWAKKGESLLMEQEKGRKKAEEFERKQKEISRWHRKDIR